MKLIRWAIENSDKNIVIITRTSAQAYHIHKEIKLNIYNFNNYAAGGVVYTYSPALGHIGLYEIWFDNETKIIIAAAEHSCITKFRGMTINVLLFCDSVDRINVNAIKRNLFGNINNESIIGELKT
jgi:hypothetical protein